MRSGGHPKFEGELGWNLGRKGREMWSGAGAGGELQRFAIAVVACQEADVYMIDEPSSYLDVRQRLKAAQVRSIPNSLHRAHAFPFFGEYFPPFYSSFFSSRKRRVQVCQPAWTRRVHVFAGDGLVAESSAWPGHSY